jgi:hypothetical protein
MPFSRHGLVRRCRDFRVSVRGGAAVVSLGTCRSTRPLKQPSAPERGCPIVMLIVATTVGGTPGKSTLVLEQDPEVAGGLGVTALFRVAEGNRRSGEIAAIGK